MTARAASGEAGPLAIVCGGGSLPKAVADAVLASGRRCVLFAIKGWADRELVAAYPHHWIDLGRYGAFRRLMQAEGCRDLVLIGKVLRPSASQVRLDWGTVRVLPRIWRAFRGGDDHMLSSFAAIMAEDGYRLVGAHEVAPDLVLPDGAVGALAPTPDQQADIACGRALLRAMSPFDVGQAAVVAAGRVLAVEAAEGTDRMLARIAELRRDGRVRLPRRAGVLVKAVKAGQDRRFDLPTIGPRTIDGVAEAGLAGVAAVAGATLMAEPKEMVRRADAAKVFLVGMREDAP